MVRILLLLVSCGALFAQSTNRLSPKEFADGWVLLFDGESSFGWSTTGSTQWKVNPDGELAVDSPESGTLVHNTRFGDYHLKIEMRRLAGTTSTIVLNAAPNGEGIAAPVAAGKKDKWHSYEIQAIGDRVMINIDDKRVLDKSMPHTGVIALKYTKGERFAVRNIKLKPFGLSPIFNGKDLGGWREVKRANARMPPVWSVKDGMLHVEHGAGQMETEGTYKNFVLQIDVRTNTDNPKLHPNSGVFLRGEPNNFWTGYESQIRNEYKDDDRSKPVDFGTGAIYRYQPTRKVVSDDNQFFTKTIVVRDRHFSIWVNGYPVTDWEDPHPEGTTVGKGEAKLTPGVISLQAHDPTTNLDFKNIRVAELK